jgi:hypothetical protein
LHAKLDVNAYEFFAAVLSVEDVRYIATILPVDSVGNTKRLVRQDDMRVAAYRLTKRDDYPPKTDKLVPRDRTMTIARTTFAVARTTFAVATLLSSVTIAFAFAQPSATVPSARPAGRITAICAERHGQLAALIEDLGDAPNFAGNKLFNALHAMTHADAVCARGHESEALALYNQAVLDLVFPVSSVR